MKEGATMANALGQQLLIDLYSCDDEIITSTTAIQESVTSAFDDANLAVDEISCQVLDDEINIIAIYLLQY